VGGRGRGHVTSDGAPGSPVGRYAPLGDAPSWASTPRPPVAGLRPELPESRGYRLKQMLLGRPLTSDQLHAERLGKPTALAVLSSDVMSSCAYATESILRILVPAAGVAAFALITPVTLLLLVLLGVVCLCYRQVVKAYPVSGGSYVVSRENFGFSVAQIPAAALLCSYVLTVAVSVAAGVDAVISAIPVLAPYPTELAVGFVVLLAFGNLRGIREAGRVFAVPTYLFLASMTSLVGAGIVRLAIDGHLPRFPLHATGYVPVGTSGSGLLLGVPAFIFLRAFANGGSAMTGMEAISNAVSVFKEPQVRNARTTLVLMATILGVMFVGVSVMAALTHAVPYLGGTPTVLSEIGRAVFGGGATGAAGFYALQFSTALILILGANTSFNGFPLLVSFIAQDAYLPRPLTTRGHRLVYSNGVLLLAAVSVALLLLTGANVSSLVPLYACTVFTGFTMAGAGMTRYHLRRRGPHRGRQITVSALAFVASAIVTAIFVATEFTRGAWLVVVAIPSLVLLLTRTHHRYEAERELLAEDLAVPAPAGRVLRHHVVVVLVDRLDLSTARALQLAGSLTSSGDVRAVHFALDAARAERIAAYWRQPGLMHVPLDVVECADRRLVRASSELAADLAADGDTEVTLVLPRRSRSGVAYRLLHDQTADRIVAAVNQIPHVSATIAPFDVTGTLRRRSADPSARSRTPKHDTGRYVMVEGATPLGSLTYRQRAVVAGRVRTVRVQPWSGVSVLECTIVDESGALRIVFLGRRSIAGIEPGAVLRAEGMVGQHGGRLAMINPSYDLVASEAGGAADATS